MKYIIAIIFALVMSGAATAGAETKRVCMDKLQNGKPVLDKAGKPQQDCREVKQHKKLEGTKVPDKK